MSWTDIHHTVCQRCSLFPFIFNLFIYDVLDNCYKYGISIKKKKKKVDDIIFVEIK